MSEITDQLVRSEMENPLDVATIERFSNEPALLAKYKKQYSGEIFAHILDQLTHKKYKSAQAELLWNEIVQHKLELNRQLGRDVGISVATLDYMTNIVDEITLAKVIDESTVDEITEIATRDKLTQLYKRAVFDVFLKEQCNAYNRYEKPFSLILMDIDDFKQINDNYGHQQGDAVLEKIGGIILDVIREPDIGARYGGEEMAVILPETEKDDAMVLAERLREKIEDEFAQQYRITVSVGVSNCPEQATIPEAMIKKADTALYQAKDLGKNRVISLT